MVDEMVDDIPTTPHLFAALDGFRRHIERRIAAWATSPDATLRGSEGRILQLIGPEGIRPTALVEGAWITKQAIAKRLREMEARGLLTISPDPADGRAVVVRRTDEGDRVLASVLRRIADLERDLARLVGAERYAEFREVLDELASE